MLVLFFGTVEFSSGVAVDRKVTLMARTHLLFSEISYLYVPAVGYVMAKAGITLRDAAYTRPRQSLCVFYPTTNPLPVNCPTS